MKPFTFIRKISSIPISFSKCFSPTIERQLISSRLLSSTSKSVNLEKPRVIWTKNFDTNSQIFNVLRRCLKFDDKEIEQLLQCYIFNGVTEESLIPTVYHLQDNGISGSQVLRVPWILLQHKDMLEKKLNFLQAGESGFICQSDALGFCKFSIPTIKKHKEIFACEYKYIPNYRNRIYYMADQLKISVPEMSDAMSTSPRLCNVTLDRLTSVVSMLNKYNISRERILRDPWVFLYNIEKSTERLQRFSEAFPNRECCLWMTRCTDSKFERTMVRNANNEYDHTLLFESAGSVSRLLAHALACPVELMDKTISMRNKTRIRPSKLLMVVNLFKEYGYTNNEIRENINLSDYSELRLRSRLNVLKGTREERLPLFTVGFSPKKFDEYIRKLNEQRPALK